MIKVTLLGAGNVGFHLFSAMHQIEGIEVIQWYNRSLKGLIPFQEKTSITDDLSTLEEADLYLIAVADDALPVISQALENKNGVVAHTAGSVPLKTLENHSAFGVFYPLQTFSKNKTVDFSTIPLCIEANSKPTEKVLFDLAEKLSAPAHRINSDQRKVLHVAAVFVNNFSNHLFAIGEELCEKNQLPFSILQPLINETIDKLNHLSPKEAQTGPALRKDQKTLDSHLQYLEKKVHQQLYSILSSSIQQQHD